LCREFHSKQAPSFRAKPKPTYTSSFSLSLFLFEHKLRIQPPYFTSPHAQLRDIQQACKAYIPTTKTTALTYRNNNIYGRNKIVMGKNTKSVPDAWEDDWEAQADKMVREPEQTTPQAPLSKSERLAQHAEQNRKLWESA
jgi:hypothetical protein